MIKRPVPAIVALHLAPAGRELRLGDEAEIRHPNIFDFRIRDLDFAFAAFEDPSIHLIHPCINRTRQRCTKASTEDLSTLRLWLLGYSVCVRFFDLVSQLRAGAGVIFPRLSG